MTRPRFFPRLRRGCTVALAVVGMLVMSAGPAAAAAGALDRTFGGDGTVITRFALGDARAYAIATQPDQKVVAVGQVTSSSGTRFAVARYDRDGSLDATFGNHGKVSTGFVGVGNAGAQAVALQGNGRIVVAGWAGNGGTSCCSRFAFALARFDADGSLDTSFSGDGRVVTDFAKEGEANAVALQANGKIVAAGRAGGAGVLMRFNPNGSLDTSFGHDGKVATKVLSIAGIVVQATGKIVDVGSTEKGLVLARWNANGTPDTSFGRDGVVVTSLHNAWASAIVLPGNGKIVAAATWNNMFTLARYNSDGSPDRSFGGDGVVTTSFWSGEADWAYGVAVQADGRIVAAGQAIPYEHGIDSGLSYGGIVVARYNRNGTLDSTFSGDGKLWTAFARGMAGARGVAIQADGRIVVAGDWNFVRFALARYVAGPQ